MADSVVEGISVEQVVVWVVVLQLLPLVMVWCWFHPPLVVASVALVGFASLVVGAWVVVTLLCCASLRLRVLMMVVDSDCHSLNILPKPSTS